MDELSQKIKESYDAFIDAIQEHDQGDRYAENRAKEALKSLSLLAKQKRKEMIDEKKAEKEAKLLEKLGKI